MAGRKLLVLTGAGASHDCIRGTVDQKQFASIDNQWKPPLVDDLFSGQTSFGKILREFPGAQQLSFRIQSEIKNSEGGLETVLLSIQEEAEHNENQKRLLFYVPLYLQKLFWEIGENYILPGPNAYKELVNRIDVSDYEQVLYLTVNYDLFLDKALEVQYDGLPEDAVPSFEEGRKLKYLKLHGSVNWGHELLGDVNPTRLHMYPRGSDPTHLIWSEPSQRFINPNEPQKWYYPILALPVTGKTGILCQTHMLEFAKGYVKECDDFLFIGFSGRDTHILQKVLAGAKPRNILFVNQDTQDAQRAQELVAKVNPNIKPRLPGSEIHYESGFFDFVWKDDLGKWMRGNLAG